MNNTDNAGIEIFLTEEQAISLRDLIGAQDPSPIRLAVGEGHSGYGLYASLIEYPEEGSLLIAPVPQSTSESAP